MHRKGNFQKSKRVYNIYKKSVNKRLKRSNYLDDCFDRKKILYDLKKNL